MSNTDFHYLPGFVFSLNGLMGDLTLVAGSNISIVPSGTIITISSTGGSPGLPYNSFQWNSAGSFAGAPAVIYDGVNDYFAAGILNTGVVALTHPFQVGGGNSYLPPTSISGAITYYTPPTAPTSPVVTPTYFQALLDSTSMTASQTDIGISSSYYLADGTVNLDFYVAPYKTVDGVKLYGPGLTTVHFTDNSDAQNFYVQLDWAAVAGATGYVIFRNGTYNGFTATNESIDLGNIITYQDTGFAFWGNTVPYPPTPHGLAYNATSNTESYRIYDYTAPIGSVKLFSTSSLNISFTDDGRSPQAPATSSAIINTSGGTYSSAGTTHSYKIFAAYTDGGYAQASSNPSVNDGGPLTVANTGSASATQNPLGSGYTATGNTMTYTIVSYRSIGGGQYVFSSGANVGFTDNSDTNPYSVDVAWISVPNATGYILYISGGPHSYTYYSIDVGNVLTYSDTDSGWAYSYPFPMNVVSDPGWVSALQNDAETGYGPADSSYNFNYKVAAYINTGRGTIYSPGSSTQNFTDNGDTSTFGVDLTFNAVISSGNAFPASGYVIWVSGTSTNNEHPTIVDINLGNVTTYADVNTGWVTSIPNPPQQPSSYTFTYQVLLSWAAVPTAVGYYVVKIAGAGGPGYPIYITTASTSISDTDSSIWTAAATNPPTPAEQPSTYDIHLSWTPGSGTYRILRDVNGGGYTTYTDTASTSLIDGNYSFSWLTSPTVANTLYHATGQNVPIKAYSYNNADAVYSSSFSSNSVTLNNSGNYASILWTASNYPTGADKLKLIINTSNGELLVSPTLTYTDINSGYNSDLVVTPTLVLPKFYSDRTGDVYIEILTIGTTIITPKIGNGNGLIQIGASASAVGAYSVSIGDGSAASDLDDITIGHNATNAGAYSIVIGSGAFSTNGVYNVGVGALSNIGLNAANSVAIGKGARIAGSVQDGVSIGNNASANSDDSISIGHNTISSGGSCAFGAAANAGGSSGVALGPSAISSSSASLAVGAGSNASGGSSSAVGNAARASGTGSSAIGFNCSASGSHSFAAGYTTSANSSSCISIGDNASVTGNFAIALGYVATAGITSIAIGFGANANGAQVDMAIGVSSAATGNFSLALGYTARSLADNASCIGYTTSCTSAASNSFTAGGTCTNASANTVLVGVASSISTSSSGSASIGNLNTLGASSSASGIFGRNNTINASSPNSYAIGQGNNITGNAAYCFGQNITLSNNNSLAIGYGSSGLAANTIEILSLGTLFLSSTSASVRINEKLGVKAAAPTALVDIGTAGGTLGTLRVYGNTSGFVQLQPAAAAGSWTFTLPPTAGTNKYLLQTDGTGISTWVQADLTASVTGILPQSNGGSGTATPAKTLFNHHVDAGNTTTSETTLYTDTTAANQLLNNDDKIEATYGGIFVSSATATREVRIYFAGTVIFDTGTLTLSLSSAWTCYMSMIRVSSTVIRYMFSFTTEGAALAAYTAVGELTGLTLSGTNILKITGQAAGVGAATNDIVAKMGYVEFKPA